MPTRLSNKRRQAVIGLDLGGTKLASGLLTGDGKPIAKRVVALEMRRGADVGALVVRETQRLLAVAARTGGPRRGCFSPGYRESANGSRLGAQHSGVDRLSAQERDTRGVVRCGREGCRRQRPGSVDSRRSLAGRGARLSRRDFPGGRHGHRRS